MEPFRENNASSDSAFPSNSAVDSKIRLLRCEKCGRLRMKRDGLVCTYCNVNESSSSSGSSSCSSSGGSSSSSVMHGRFSKLVNPFRRELMAMVLFDEVHWHR